MPERAVGSATTPCCHRVAMTARSDTLEKGQESAGIDWENKRMREELEPLDGEALSLVVEEQKQEMRESADAVARALLNGDVALTDEKVGELWECASRFEALSRVLVRRVPEEHREYE